jgi:hypothetical protein
MISFTKKDFELILCARLDEIKFNSLTKYTLMKTVEAFVIATVYGKDCKGVQNLLEKLNELTNEEAQLIVSIDQCGSCSIDNNAKRLRLSLCIINDIPIPFHWDNIETEVIG